MATEAARRKIAAWLMQIAAHTRHKAGEEPSDREIRLAAAALAEEFPDEAFTSASFQAIWAKAVYFPKGGELVRLVREWWEAHKPAAYRVIDPPGIERLSDTAASWVRYRVRRLAEISEQNQSRAQDEMDRSRLDHLIRQYSPEAWEFISGENVGASIAALDRRMAELQVEWGDILTVRAAIRTLDTHDWPVFGFRLLRGLLGRHSPENLNMLEAAQAHREGRSPVYEAVVVDGPDFSSMPPL